MEADQLISQCRQPVIYDAIPLVRIPVNRVANLDAILGPCLLLSEIVPDK